MELKFPRDNFDQDNTFAIAYYNYRNMERTMTAYLFYSPTEGRIYIMQKSACLKDHYTDKDMEESARLKAQVPVRHDDIVELQGAQYRVHINGNYSDAGYLIPMEQPL
jgi:hypothetical protein